MTSKAISKKMMGQKRRSSSENIIFNLMVLPGILLLILFAIVPMGGIVIAFQNYVPAKGFFRSEWVGFENFELLAMLPDSLDVLRNTLVLACSKLVLSTFVQILFALILNEIRSTKLKRGIQTAVYLPYFLSWVILGSIFLSMFSVDGVVNKIVIALGGDAIMFMADNTWAPIILIITDIWKNFGYGSIIYLAALSGIDENLYEAAALDGAGKFAQIWHVTLPGLLPTIVLVSTLSLGSILNAGFDQIFNMYNPLIYQSCDVIDTYVYRIGLVDLNFSLSTAVGLLKSVVSMILILTSYALAHKFSDYEIF